MGKLVSFYFAYSRSFQETVDVKWGLIVLHSDQYMQTLTESYSYMRLAVFQELGGLKHLYIEHFYVLGIILGSGNGTIDKIDCGFSLLGLTL